MESVAGGDGGDSTRQRKTPTLMPQPTGQSLATPAKLTKGPRKRGTDKERFPIEWSSSSESDASKSKKKKKSKVQPSSDSYSERSKKKKKRRPHGKKRNKNGSDPPLDSSPSSDTSSSLDDETSDDSSAADKAELCYEIAEFESADLPDLPDKWDKGFRKLRAYVPLTLFKQSLLEGFHDEDIDQKAKDKSAISKV